MTDAPEGRNLPAIVEMVGGAALEVLQWPDHASLSDDQISKMMIIVQNNRTLNTTSAVDMLADAAAHHGEELDRWFEGVVKAHGVATVHETLETLWEIGARSATRTAGSAVEERQERNDDLTVSLQFMGNLKELRIETSDVHSVADLIHRLGGWSTARELSLEEISEFLDTEEVTGSGYDADLEEDGLSSFDAGPEASVIRSRSDEWVDATRNPVVDQRESIARWLESMLVRLGQVTGLDFAVLVERAELKVHTEVSDRIDSESLTVKQLELLQDMRRHKVLKLVDIKLTASQAVEFRIRRPAKKTVAQKGKKK